jgi:flagellar basal-body rod modification protein FlgD
MAIAPVGSDLLQANATAGLKLDDLLRVLLTELTHQDPFKPVDNKDFMAQIAQFASLDSSRQLNDNLVQLLSVQALNQSVGLIGLNVSADLGGGQVIDGVVKAVDLQTGVPHVTIQDQFGNNIANVTLGQLTTIRRPGQ